jgi:hypothetical protein
MQSLGKGPRRHRHAFTLEFKAEIVELCQRGDRSVGQVARSRPEPVPPPAYCGARSEPCRAAGALLPVRLLAAAADLAAGGVGTMPGPRLR